MQSVIEYKPYLEVIYSALLPGRTPVLISDSHVAPLYANALAAKLDTIPIIIPAGEAHKTRETKAWIEDEMLRRGLGRDSCVIALGGGVVTDMAGFVAATYCRGVPVIYMPSSLLAMVDAAVGGKTAVNTPAGKNMIGVFKQPDQVIIDVALLKTLPEHEVASGMAEHIKHALLADANLFTDIAQHIGALSNVTESKWQAWVRASCAIKQHVVEQDFREQGIRAVLNLGHTIAHALEQVSDYQVSHGEAVTMGLQIEADIAVAMGLLCHDVARQICVVLQQLKFDSSFVWTEQHLRPILQVMRLDKKARAQTPYFCLLADIGKVAHADDQGVLFMASEVIIEQACRSFFASRNRQMSFL